MDAPHDLFPSGNTTTNTEAAASSTVAPTSVSSSCHTVSWTEYSHGFPVTKSFPANCPEPTVRCTFTTWTVRYRGHAMAKSARNCTPLANTTATDLTLAPLPSSTGTTALASTKRLVNKKDIKPCKPRTVRAWLRGKRITTTFCPSTILDDATSDPASSSDPTVPPAIWEYPGTAALTSTTTSASVSLTCTPRPLEIYVHGRPTLATLPCVDPAITSPSSSTPSSISAPTSPSTSLKLTKSTSTSASTGTGVSIESSPTTSTDTSTSKGAFTTCKPKTLKVFVDGRPVLKTISCLSNKLDVNPSSLTLFSSTETANLLSARNTKPCKPRVRKNWQHGFPDFETTPCPTTSTTTCTPKTITHHVPNGQPSLRTIPCPSKHPRVGPTSSQSLSTPKLMSSLAPQLPINTTTSKLIWTTTVNGVAITCEPTVVDLNGLGHPAVKTLGCMTHTMHLNHTNAHPLPTEAPAPVLPSLSKRWILPNTTTPIGTTGSCRPRTFRNYIQGRPVYRTMSCLSGRLDIEPGSAPLLRWTQKPTSTGAITTCNPKTIRDYLNGQPFFRTIPCSSGTPDVKPSSAPVLGWTQTPTSVPTSSLLNLSTGNATKVEPVTSLSLSTPLARRDVVYHDLLEPNVVNGLHAPRVSEQQGVSPSLVLLIVILVLIVSSLVVSAVALVLWRGRSRRRIKGGR